MYRPRNRRFCSEHWVCGERRRWIARCFAKSGLGCSTPRSSGLEEMPSLSPRPPAGRALASEGRWRHHNNSASPAQRRTTGRETYAAEVRHALRMWGPLIDASGSRHGAPLSRRASDGAHICRATYEPIFFRRRRDEVSAGSWRSISSRCRFASTSSKASPLSVRLCLRLSSPLAWTNMVTAGWSRSSK
jgi:hypothetical protein